MLILSKLPAECYHERRPGGWNAEDPTIQPSILEWLVDQLILQANVEDVTM
jgi:hypothetical protein